MARTDARSSAIMAAGTLVSRILGFVKTILLTVAIGSLSTVGDVFETANTLPNLIYVLVAGGVFNAVLVPQIIKAAKAQDGGARYISKLVTLTVTAIGLVTLITVACAWPIISVMGSGWTPEQRQDGDDVVQHGRPHVRAEGVLRVEHLPNDGVEAVEEDLG